VILGGVVRDVVAVDDVLGNCKLPAYRMIHEIEYVRSTSNAVPASESVLGT
jgi:hypothetical protein